MDRNNHYEAAFEAYLQHHGYCHVAVDETRRASLGDATMKSLDFIVHSPHGNRLLIDVKGRRFPAGSSQRPRPVWECWSTLEDVRGLERWAELFGPGYQSLLVFAYELMPIVCVPEATPDLWHWRGRRYLYRAVLVEAYARHMRIRSPRWGTVTLPGAVFRDLVQPFRAFGAREPVFAQEGLFDS